MLANDARILIRSAAATAVAGAILIIIGAVVAGGKGAFGAVLAVILVTVFFTLSVVTVSLAGRYGHTAMMAAGVGIYLVKIIAVLAIVVAFRNTTAFNTKLFGATAIICILVWSAGQVATLARRKIPYVEPETPAGGGAPSQHHAGLTPRAGGGASEARQSGPTPPAGEP